MIRCGNPCCGCLLVAAKGTTVRNGKKYLYRRYACRPRNGRDACNGVGIIAQPLEDLITEAVFDRIEAPLLSKAIEKWRGARSAKSVERIQQRLDELADMFAAGAVSKTEWATARTSLIRRLDEAKTAEAAEVRLASAAAQLARPDSLRTEWPQMSVNRRRMILRALIDHITLAPRRSGKIRFDPNRVDITWKM
jgi:hypothetical protein